MSEVLINCKRIIICVIFILLIPVFYAKQNRLWGVDKGLPLTEYYEKDLKKKEYYRLNGSLHGVYNVWYRNGLVKCSGQFVNGKRVGIWKYFYASGKMKELQTLDNEGSLYGANVEWYQNGKIKRSRFFKKGLLYGEYREWYKSGAIKLLASFKQDKKYGKEEQWYESGILWTFSSYKEGKKNGESYAFYKNGQPQSLQSFLEGMLDGLNIIWEKNGTIIYKANYKKNIRVPLPGDRFPTVVWTVEKYDFKPSLKQLWKTMNNKPVDIHMPSKRSEGLMINGKKQGVWRYWNRQGILILMGEYRYGQKINKWKLWNNKGISLPPKWFMDNKEISGETFIPKKQP